MRLSLSTGNCCVMHTHRFIPIAAAIHLRYCIPDCPVSISVLRTSPLDTTVVSRGPRVTCRRHEARRLDERVLVRIAAAGMAGGGVSAGCDRAGVSVRDPSLCIQPVKPKPCGAQIEAVGMHEPAIGVVGDCMARCSTPGANRRYGECGAVPGTTPARAGRSSAVRSHRPRGREIILLHARSLQHVKCSAVIITRLSRRMEGR